MPIEPGNLSLGVLAGGLIGTFAGHYLTKSRSMEERRVSAAYDLRAAFAPAIFKFKILSDFNKINDMLREELVPQGIAIERFRPFVKNKEAYQEAWENYYTSHHRDGVASVYFLDYAMGEENERFALFNQRINDIVKFAESEPFRDFTINH